MPLFNKILTVMREGTKKKYCKRKTDKIISYAPITKHETEVVTYVGSKMAR